MPVARSAPPWCLALLLVGGAACAPGTNSANGPGQAPASGGPLGSACNPKLDLQGCDNDQPVLCEPADNVWQALSPCPPGAHCVTLAASATGAASLRLAACETAGSDSRVWPGTVNDGSSVGADSGSTADAWPASCGDGSCAEGEDVDSCPMDCHDKLAATLKCVDQKCDGAWGQCVAALSCAAAIKCIAGCPDDACIKACEAAAGDHLPALKAVLDCTICRDGA